MKGYLVAFRGQGGFLTSWGVDRMAGRARKLGYVAEVYNYSAGPGLADRVMWFRRQGYLTAGLGYSLGVSALTELQRRVPFDLVLCVAGSRLGRNYPISKTTKRSVLWWANRTLSGGGLDLGFTERIEVRGAAHLLMDFAAPVVDGVDRELRRLVSRGE